MAQPVMQPKSRSVLGATELTLMASIKGGLIPALDSRSYQSRAKIVLDTLHALGVSRREIDPTPAIAEVADTIRAIRSFRLAIAGADQRQLQLQPQIVLSVSFDGGWEPYIRRIWRPLGPLLDLIFCNCEGYLLSSNHGFPAYAGWVRQAQMETGFYYEDSALTVSDQHLLKEAKGLPSPAPAPATVGDLYQQARAAMVAFYRLTDMHPDLPGIDDGVVLRRAARLLLGELSKVVVKSPPQAFLRTDTEKAAWTWFCKDLPPTFKAEAPKTPNLANVQAGILEPYPGPTLCGSVVLVGLDDAAAVDKLIERVEPMIISADAPPYKTQGPLFVNLAFTYGGLVLAGVDPGTLEQLPAEFREGMEARAGILGDWQHNHPQRWALPQQHGGGPSERVPLSTVHAVVQFWRTDQDTAALVQAVVTLDTALRQAGGRVLAVQPMQRTNQNTGAAQGHFGFADGLSQPGLAASARLQRDTVMPGELLLGYSNERNDNALEGRLWNDSTFLVLRKLRQDVKAFQELKLGDDAKARLMGRRPDGTNLIDGSRGNDFDYTGDDAGSKCPLYAHIRRANPRAKRENELDILPRIVRRGMSYGPPYNDKKADNEERGLMFMAYNTSIAEQFEVVQGWLAGRNSSGPGSFSGLRDPFLGVARAGDPRRYALAFGSVELPADKPLVTLQWGMYAFVPSIPALRELRTWARERALEDKVQGIDEPEAKDYADAVQRKRDRRNREEARQAGLGSALIARLQRVEQELGFDAAVERWKIALEDPGTRMQGASQAIWTAVRRAHNGVLRTPYGVLVCSKTLVEQVFANVHGNYTVSGYNTRLAESFGEIYLGRDEGDAYRAEAELANPRIMAVTKADAFESAYRQTKYLLEEETINGLAAGEYIAVEVRDLVDGLLARFCVEWFGLPDGQFVQPGGWHWRDAATCPGHFHSPSRYTFQPHPGVQAQKAGEEHGQLLYKQVLDFVRATRWNLNGQGQGRLGGTLFTAFLPNEERLASNLIGVMMGFLPTVDGNLRGALFEWVRDRSLWDHQAALRAAKRATDLERAQVALGKELGRAMQLRPVPEVVWRTALRAHTLGPLEVRAGDTVVVSIVSATQDDLLSGRDCPFIVFGGKRKRGPKDDPSKPIPTHACPGYDMAMGVMLGFLAALMDTVSLRPAASPMVLRIGPR